MPHWLKKCKIDKGGGVISSALVFLEGVNILNKQISFYTDGSCRGNPGPGGYAAVCFDDNVISYKYADFYERTTNNEMELKSINHVLNIMDLYIKFDTYDCVIYCDSAYAINCLTEWSPAWELNEWKNSKGEEIANCKVIQETYELYKRMIDRVHFIKVKGHKNNIGNELADALCTKNSSKFDAIVKDNSLRFGCLSIL